MSNDRELILDIDQLELLSLCVSVVHTLFNQGKMSITKPEAAMLQLSIIHDALQKAIHK